MKWTLGGFHLLGYSMRLTTVNETSKTILYSVPIRLILTEFEETHALLFMKDRRALLQLVVDFCDFHYIFQAIPNARQAVGRHVFGIVNQAASRLRQCLRDDVKQVTLKHLTQRTMHVHVIKTEPTHERTRLI